MQITDIPGRDWGGAERRAERRAGDRRRRGFQGATVAVGIAAAASLAVSQVQARRLEREVSGLRHSVQQADVQRLSIEQRVEEHRRRAAEEKLLAAERRVAIQQSEQALSGRLETAPEGDVATLQQALEEAQERLESLETERSIGERVIRDYGAGVCLIQGSYGFFDTQDRPLRIRLDGDGQPMTETDGSPALDVTGEGPLHSVDYYGTGFLVDQRGVILTNRHIAEPWWNDDDAEQLRQAGFKPRFIFLRAYFPHQSSAFALTAGNLSPEVDLGIVHADLRGKKIPVLPLDEGGRKATPGHPVVVVGYPTGLEAIMAKAETRVVKGILDANGSDTQRVTQALSDKGLIRPSTTQGHIGDVTGSDIVFDAPTTQGGSGGPLFDASGRVIAVEYAVLPKFGGNSFAVPIAYAHELVKTARARVPRAD